MSEIIVRGKPSELYECHIVMGAGDTLTHQELYDLVKPEGWSAQIVEEVKTSDKILTPTLCRLEPEEDADAFGSLIGEHEKELGNDLLRDGAMIGTSAPIPKKTLVRLKLLKHAKQAKGASPNTNLFSWFGHVLEKTGVKTQLPKKLPAYTGYPIIGNLRYAPTSHVFKLIGRWVPYVGWCLLAYDIGDYVTKKTTGKPLWQVHAETQMRGISPMYFKAMERFLK